MKTDNSFNLSVLSSGAERLLLTLIYYAQTKNECFPSQDTLLQSLKISKRTLLWKYINELISHNLVTYQRYTTMKKISNGKVIPERHIKYIIVKHDWYYSIGDYSSTLYLNLSDRSVPLGSILEVPVIIHKSYKNSNTSIEQEKPSKKVDAETSLPYKALIVEFNRRYSTNLFPTFGKQAKAIKVILQSYTESDIWACSEWLSKDQFWKQKGFDFSTIQSQLAKYKMTLQTSKPKEVYVNAKSV